MSEEPQKLTGVMLRASYWTVGLLMGLWIGFWLGVPFARYIFKIAPYLI